MSARRFGLFGSKVSRRARLRTNDEAVARALRQLALLVAAIQVGIAMTQKLRRIIDEGVTLGLALEGISAADVARDTPK
jgi:hypothetical protein